MSEWTRTGDRWSHPDGRWFELYKWLDVAGAVWLDSEGNWYVGGKRDFLTGGHPSEFEPVFAAVLEAVARRG